jgi:exosome complex component CSL4
MSLRLSASEKRLVLPGEALGVIEEYNAGPGTYVDPFGVIRASISGVLRIDRVGRTLSVVPQAGAPTSLPQYGDIVLGVVTNIRPDLVIVEVHARVLLSPSGPRILGEFKGKLTGAIPISYITDERIKDVHDYFRIGDIILAKTLNNTNPYTLTTKEPPLGVVYAECARCGAPLRPISNKAMKCPACGNVESRKVSTLAGHKGLANNIRWWLISYQRLW